MNACRQCWILRVAVPATRRAWPGADRLASAARQRLAALAGRRSVRDRSERYKCPIAAHVTTLDSCVTSERRHFSSTYSPLCVDNLVERKLGSTELTSSCAFATVIFGN
jgi:hypothetical protein